MPPDPGLAERVHRRLLDGPEPAPHDLHRRIEHLARDEAPLLDADAVTALVEGIAARTIGLGPLEPLLADPAVTEIMVNGPGPVWVERAGTLERLALVLDRVTVDLLVERVVAPLGLRVDRTAPVVDARLPDGSRVNVVVPPLAIDGPCVTIRRFGAVAVGLDDLASPPVAALLDWAVRAHANIVVTGGTGAGKTTLLNALAARVAPGERVITIEDAAELRLLHDHVVRLESRPANAEGAGAVCTRELVRNALRMRPDRIVVGEVRGGEALDMLQAMNTGHDGSLSTCHANSPADALRRLASMVVAADGGLPLAAVRELVAAALDLVVQVGRTEAGRRAVIAVDEVVPLGDAPGDRPLTVRRLATANGVRDRPSRQRRAVPVPAA